jgi:hypothetical protein
MARVETVELTGFKELEQALRALPKATGKNTLRRTAKGALDPMASLAAARAPHRTGRLAYSITVSEKRTRRAKGSTTRFVGGLFRAEASKGIEMAMGPAGGLGYMRAAWDSGAYKALDYVKEQLAVEINKATARFIRKQARLI